MISSNPARSLPTAFKCGLAGAASVAPDFSDAKLEQLIDFQAGLIATATTREEQIAAETELRRLHALRSPARVEQMEREQGLR